MAPVVRFAAEHGLLLSLRGGGHNVAGNGTVDGGIVLNLGALKDITVDVAAATVTAAPGLTLGDLDTATEAVGLIVPVGVVSGTGLIGLTLGGGFGWLTRPYGLTIDNVLAAELITASGEQVRASALENAELFWGLRGGGGNFGVVTSITYQAQRLGPRVFSGNLIYHRRNWRAALEAYSRWTQELPDALTSIVTFVVPPASFELGDDTVMLVGFTWVGADQAGGERLVDALRGMARPDGEVVEPARWVDWQSQADGLFPRGSRAYWKNVPFDRLGANEVSAVLSHVERLRPGSAVDIHHMGGAVARVPGDATPFPDRAARYWVNVYGFWSDPADDAEGGDLVLYRFRDEPGFYSRRTAMPNRIEEVARIPYAANTLVLFANSINSVHGVTPRKPNPHVRRYINFQVELENPIFEIPYVSPVNSFVERVLG